MPGLEGQDGVPQRGWRKVGECHPQEDGSSPDCEWCDIKNDDRKVIFVLEHDDFDRQIRVGSTCVEKATANDSGFGSHGNGSGSVTENQGNDRSPPPPEDSPLPALVALAVGSTVLIGNLALLDNFISPSDLLLRPFTNRSTPQNPSNPSRSPGSGRNGSRPDRLSPQIQAQLRTCLKANIERIAQVPSLSELATSLLGEDEASITETQRQVRALYKTVNELYKLITECDPIFIQALLDTEDPEDLGSSNGNGLDPASPVSSCVTVTVERVNIRVAPSLDSAVIAQALLGTCFQVDAQLVASLPKRQRLALKMGEDWYPVLLPDGNRGYIFSSYVTEVDQQRE